MDFETGLAFELGLGLVSGGGETCGGSNLGELDLLKESKEDEECEAGKRKAAAGANNSGSNTKATASSSMCFMMLLIQVGLDAEVMRSRKAGRRPAFIKFASTSQTLSERVGLSSFDNDV